MRSLNHPQKTLYHPQTEMRIKELQRRVAAEEDLDYYPITDWRGHGINETPPPVAARGQAGSGATVGQDVACQPFAQEEYGL